MDEKTFSQSRYTHRDYETTKEDLLSVVPSLTQKWTDFSEASPGVVYIKLLSMMTDNLSYNFDKNALELYKDTVTQRKNCAKILRLLGYKMHWYRSAMSVVTVMVDPTQENKDSVELTTYETIITAGSKSYVLTKKFSDIDSRVGVKQNFTLLPGESDEFEFIEGSIGSVQFNKSSITNNKIVLPDTNIDEAHIWLEDSRGKVIGTLVDDIKTQTETYNVFYELDIDDYGSPYLLLSDNWSGIITTDSVVVKYIVSSGVNGVVTDNAFDEIVGSVNVRMINKSNAKETLYGRPGKNPETVEEALEESSKYIFTLDSLVTEKDFERACLRVNGVVDSKLLDQFLLDESGLDASQLAELLETDSIPYQDETYILYVGSILLYIIYGDYMNNSYKTDLYTDDDGRIRFFNKPNYLKVKEPWSEDKRYVGYYPYKPDGTVIDAVQDYIDSKKNMTVTEYFGTSRLYPYIISGNLYLQEPLSPQETLAIVNKIDNDLSELFSVENVDYSEIPDMLDVVDCIQNSDSRIRYFNSGRVSPINYLITSTTDEDLTHPLARSVYAGLSWSDKLFNETGRPYMTLNKECMRFIIKYNPGPLEEVTEIPPLEEIPVPDGIPVDDVHKYEKIVVHMEVGEEKLIECKNIAQLNTLVWWITNKSSTFIYRNGK